MKLFGWKGAAASPRPVLSRAYGWSGGGGALGEWPVAYEPQVRAAILANPVAQRAVRLISESAAHAAVHASGAGARDNDRALRMLGCLSGGQGLVETLALHLVLHGNGYVQILCDGDGQPVELFALRPERISVDVDARGWPVAYVYRVGDRATRLPAEDGAGRTAILHLKAINPLDDHYGLGCLGAASGPVAIHNAANVQTVLHCFQIYPRRTDLWPNRITKTLIQNPLISMRDSVLLAKKRASASSARLAMAKHLLKNTDGGLLMN